MPASATRGTCKCPFAEYRVAGRRCGAFVGVLFPESSLVLVPAACGCFPRGIPPTPVGVRSDKKAKMGGSPIPARFRVIFLFLHVRFLKACVLDGIRS